MSCTKVPNTLWSQFETRLIHIEDKLQTALDTTVTKATESNAALVGNAMTQMVVLRTLSNEDVKSRHEDIKTTLREIQTILDGPETKERRWADVQASISNLDIQLAEIQQKLEHTCDVQEELHDIRETLADFFQSTTYSNIEALAQSPTRLSCEGLWLYFAMGLASATWASTLVAVWFIRWFPLAMQTKHE